MEIRGPHAEASYQQHLKSLRSHPKAVVEILKRLDATPRPSFAKWKLVHLLSELRDPAAVPVLYKLATEPWHPDAHPPRRPTAAAPTQGAPDPRRPTSPSDVGRKTTALKSAKKPDYAAILVAKEQSMIQREAVWALEKTAKFSATKRARPGGNKQALSSNNALRQLLTGPHEQVRIAASLALYRQRLLTAADKAAMATVGLTGLINVRSYHALTMRARPRADLAERAAKLRASRPVRQFLPVKAAKGGK